MFCKWFYTSKNKDVNQKSCLIVYLSNMYRNPDANAQNLSSTKQNKKRNTNVYFVSF